jgi:hypothetical protein
MDYVLNAPVSHQQLPRQKHTQTRERVKGHIQKYRPVILSLCRVVGGKPRQIASPRLREGGTHGEGDGYIGVRDLENRKVTRA